MLEAPDKLVITICEHHQYYQTPLIMTFAFPGSEWLCPYCGRNGGLLDMGLEVPLTRSLVKRHTAFVKYIRPYIRAIGRRTCLRAKINRKWVAQADIPRHVRAKDANIIHNHKWYKKAFLGVRNGRQEENSPSS